MLKILLEFAMEKAALEQRIDSQEINIRNHAIKIMVLVETNLEDHWAGEIGGFCDSLNNTQKRQHNCQHRYFQHTKFFHKNR